MASHSVLRALLGIVIALGAWVSALAADDPQTEAERIIPALLRQDYRTDRPRPDRAPPVRLIGAIDPAAYPAYDEPLLLTGVEAHDLASISSDYIARVFGEMIGDHVSIEELKKAIQFLSLLQSDRDASLRVVYAQPQKLASGVLQLDATDGTISAVSVRGVNGSVRARLLRMLNGLVDGRPVTARRLQRTLMIAERTPGLRIEATLSPDRFGAGSLLDVYAETTTDKVTVSVDNQARATLGREIVVASAESAGFFSSADRTEASLYRNLGPNELLFVEGVYGSFLGASAAELETYFFAGRVDANSSTQTGSGFSFESVELSGGVSFPVILDRRSQLDLYVRVAFKDDRAVFGAVSSKDVRWQSTLGFDITYTEKNGAETALDVQLMRGWDLLNASERGDGRSSRGGDNEEFWVAKLDFQREQPLIGGVGADLQIRGQMADKSLFFPDQCAFGGRSFGRAFDVDTLNGDQCLLASLEISDKRRKPTALQTEFAPYVFIDGGVLQPIRAPGETATTQGLLSTGVGSRVYLGDVLSVRLEGGWPLRSDPATAKTPPPRFYFQLELAY